MVSPGTMYPNSRVSSTWIALAVLALASLAACEAEVAKYKATGNLRFNQGQYEQARDAYRRAVEAAPNDATAHTLLGNALVELTDYAGARVAYQRALQLTPGSPEAHRGMMTVISHTAPPGAPEAFRDYLGHAEALVAAAPKDKSAIITAGIVTSEAANPNDPELYALAQAQAESYLRRALALDDRDPRLLFHLALVYARKQEPEVALRVVERLAGVEPQPGLHLYAGAIVQTIAGDRDEALVWVQKLLATNTIKPNELAHPTGYLAPLLDDPRFPALIEAAATP